MSVDKILKTIDNYIHPSQEAICRSEDRHIMIEGVAGSRKTDTMIRLGLRRYLTNKKRNLLFLTQVGSVSDEICRRIEGYLKIPVLRQNSSNHYMASMPGRGIIEVANFDAWVHRQLEQEAWPHLHQMGSYHSHKVQELIRMCDKVQGFCMKNGSYADEILIDECQDFEISKANLVISLLNRLKHVNAIFAGDYMQTLFERSILTSHPITVFKTLPSIGCYHLTRCYRCPRAHIDFCNLVMGDAFRRHGCRMIEPVDQDRRHRPFLFTHGNTSRQHFDVLQLVHQCCDMLNILLKHDKDIRPSDVCFLMRKCNDQMVFEFLRVRLESFWAARGYRNAVIHFATQFDGYRNSIQWNFADDKTCLLSIHGDKGKGHKVVFVLGITQKSLPDECSMHKPIELLCESLLNVALTRSTRYLFIGFHHSQPSIYLSRIMNRLKDEAYMGWTDNIQDDLYRELATVMRFPTPTFMNHFRESALGVPTLNFLSTTDISRRYERIEDVLNYRPKMETIVFGKKIHFSLPHDLYPILGHMAELMLLQLISPTVFQRDIQMWSDPSNVVLTEDERLLCWVHDFSLHQWIGTDMFMHNLNMMEEAYSGIIKNDAGLSDCVQRLKKKQAYVLPQAFHAICSRPYSSLAKFSDWWNLALLFHEIKAVHRKPCLYRYIDMEISAHQTRTFHIFQENIRALATRFSKNVVFHPHHDLIAQANEPELLQQLGFMNHPDLDERFFKNGYYYGITGISDVIDVDTNTLFEIKASHVDLSIEWILQTSLYGVLPLRQQTSIGRIKNLVLANVMTGKLYQWEKKKSATRVFRNILTERSFPEVLIERLIKKNHRRLKQSAEEITAN